MEPLDVVSVPSGATRRAVLLVSAFLAFTGLIAAGCLVALLTQPLDGNQRLSALVIGGMGSTGVVYGLRALTAARSFSRPVVLARLDADGAHLHQGAGLPDDLAWLTLPWSWIPSVSHTSFDATAARALGAETPFEALRFVVADDNLLDPPPPYAAEVTGVLALWLGLTPTQVRTVLVGAPASPEHQQVLGWLRAHQPHLPVVEGTTAPWSTKASVEHWPGQPRVAVVGAHGRLGRLVVTALAPLEYAAPVALVRNEAHRAALERLGAEVRMIDLERQGPVALAAALRGCSTVVHLAGGSLPVVVDAARRARVERVVLVSGPTTDDPVSHLDASGLAWTAFRPASLTDASPTGEIALGLDVSPGPVPRGDLADVIVAALRDDASVGAVWGVAGAPPAAS